MKHEIKYCRLQNECYTSNCAVIGRLVQSGTKVYILPHSFHCVCIAFEMYARFYQTLYIQKTRKVSSMA